MENQLQKTPSLAAKAFSYFKFRNKRIKLNSLQKQFLRLPYQYQNIFIKLDSEVH